MEPVGRLKRVPLRHVWQHESLGFTKWLQDNLDVLNEHLDVALESAEREQPAGTFSVDLVAEDANGDVVIIENQLERTDHDHLGKLLTYLTAYDSSRAIWIASDPRPEHVKAVAWLNDSTPASFYLFKVEAVVIGESQPAPLITPIVGPSLEGKQVAASKKERGQLHAARREFFRQLLETAAERTDLHAHISPSDHPFVGTGAGRSGLRYEYWVRKDDCRALLWIDRGRGSDEENLAIYEQLLERKQEIEAEFGGLLEWDEMPGKQACKITANVPGSSGWQTPVDEREEGMQLTADAMARLAGALGPRIAQLALG